MEIEKDRELGLCFGVKRALKLLRDAAGKYWKVETLGLVAHNPRLMEELYEAGVKSVNQFAQVQGNVLAIGTHGVSPRVLSEIESAHISMIIDTTCPIVQKAQATAKELAEASGLSSKTVSLILRRLTHLVKREYVRTNNYRYLYYHIGDA